MDIILCIYELTTCQSCAIWHVLDKCTQLISNVCYTGGSQIGLISGPSKCSFDWLSENLKPVICMTIETFLIKGAALSPPYVAIVTSVMTSKRIFMHDNNFT